MNARVHPAGHALLPLAQQQQGTFVHIIIDQHQALFGLFYQIAGKHLGIEQLTREENTLSGFCFGFQRFEYPIQSGIGQPLFLFHPFQSPDDAIQLAQGFAHGHKGLHDPDTYLYGNLCIQDCREHGHTLFGKSYRQSPPSAMG